MITVYEGRDGLWFWRFMSQGKIMADGGEGYATASNARRAARRVGFKMTFARVDTVPRG